jgi:hypothetical protein
MLAGAFPQALLRGDGMEPAMTIELTAQEFERRYQALTLRASTLKDNDGCVECQRCTGCSACTFCADSQRLVRCHFCVRCASCTDSLHCRGSRNLIGCQHCSDCDACSHSSYLVRCLSLTSCQYCFGCVGLSGKDFHVLNEPYDRKAYFALTARLSRELRR